MRDQDKAATQIPESPQQKFIAQVDRRDKLMRAAEVIVLLSLAVFNVLAAVGTQTVINQNQKNTLEARQQNIDRQNQLKSYIKCVLLIRYDTPPENLTTRKGTEAALDKCANSSGS